MIAGKLFSIVLYTWNIVNEKSKIQSNLRELLQKVEQLPYVLKKLDQSGVRYGLYAGTHVAVLCNNRIPTDVDLLVHDDDLSKLRELFPFAKTKDVGDGVFLYVGHDDIIEFMGLADITHPDAVYQFRFTDLAVSKLTKHSVDGHTIAIVDPVDTLLLKAILQRGEDVGKHDLEDIDAVLTQMEIDTEYLRMRLNESGAVKRTEYIWKKYGIEV